MNLDDTPPSSPAGPMPQALTRLWSDVSATFHTLLQHRAQGSGCHPLVKIRLDGASTPQIELLWRGAAPNPVMLQRGKEAQRTLHDHLTPEGHIPLTKGIIFIGETGAAASWREGVGGVVPEFTRVAAVVTARPGLTLLGMFGAVRCSNETRAKRLTALAASLAEGESRVLRVDGNPLTFPASAHERLELATLATTRGLRSLWIGPTPNRTGSLGLVVAERQGDLAVIHSLSISDRLSWTARPSQYVILKHSLTDPIDPSATTPLDVCAASAP